jgi:endonuclease G
LFERTAYTASYNRKDRIPHWVGEHLTSESIKAGDGVSRDKSHFIDDPALPAIFRAYTKDYTNSGYDRGHMAPAGDATASQSGLDETFLLTNIVPQIGPGFNRQYWAYLEMFCRKMTTNYTDVFVYTGPLFLPQLDNNSGGAAFAFADAKIQFDAQNGVVTTTSTTAKDKYKMQYNVIGTNSPNVAVPTHFFKILLLMKEEEGYTLGSFVLPNQAIDHSIPLSKFQVNLQAIEKASGLLFFQALDRSTFLNLCDMVACIV